jgi:NAD(P)-dependent dehydrogenase (short-subunit alcohol dehydrogenase family)
MSVTIAELSSLKGRVALVVGGGGHIGGRIADALGELGADIAVADLDIARAAEVASRVSHEHRVRTEPMLVDLEDAAATRALVGEVAERFGRLDVLVHAAALVGTTPLPGWSTSLPEQSLETWRRALEVNLTSAFVICQAAAPLLDRSGEGSIVLVSSIYGLLGSDPGLYEGTEMAAPGGYFASKGGLMQLMRWLATELAPHVRVNAICPGGVERGQDPQFIRRYEAKTPMRRLAIEDDLIGAAAYLASNLSSYVTGQQLIVDGGLSIR